MWSPSGNRAHKSNITQTNQVAFKQEEVTHALKDEKEVTVNLFLLFYVRHVIDFLFSPFETQEEDKVERSRSHRLHDYRSYSPRFPSVPYTVVSFEEVRKVEEQKETLQRHESLTNTISLGGRRQITDLTTNLEHRVQGGLCYS